MTEAGKTLQVLVARGLLDSLPDGLLVCDAEGTIRAVNGRLEELSGYSASELVGGHVEVLVPQELRIRHEQHRTDFASSGHPTRPMGTDLEIQLLTSDRHRVSVDVALSALRVDEETLVVAAIRDALPRIRQELSVRAMRSVTEAILRGTPADDIYSLVCDQAVDLIRASLALVALRSENGSGFRVAAASDATGGGKEFIGEVLTGDPWDAAVRTDHWTVLGSPESLVLRARSLGPSVVFPLPEGQRLGFLLVADEPGRPSFDRERLEIVENFAVQAGLAFAYGRRLRAIAVSGDRERIARDLHDLIIQRLFGAGLSLQATAQIYNNETDLTRRLSEVIESLDAAIDELRRSIFDLDHKRTLGFRDRVLITVQEVISDHRLQSRVDVSPDDAPLPEETVGHLLATLREALSNTGRHAQATTVEVSVVVGPDLALTVSDDGNGIDAGAPMGHGLVNMRERAQGLGGDLLLSRSTQGGLQLEWRVPL